MKVNIHNIKKNQTESIDLKHINSVNKFYGKGNLESSTQFSEAYAYSVLDGALTNYFVFGAKNGHFYDPYNSDVKYKYEWMKVSEKVFSSYVEYLKTNKQALLTAAEQGYIYG